MMVVWSVNGESSSETGNGLIRRSIARKTSDQTYVHGLVMRQYFIEQIYQKLKTQLAMNNKINSE